MYVLFSTDSDLDLLGNLIRRAGFAARLVAEQSIFIESLIIYELRCDRCRSHPHCMGRLLHGPSLTTPEFRDIFKEDIASGRVGRCNQRRTAMIGYPPRKPKSARRVAFPKWVVVGAIAGAALISACSQPSDSQ